VPGGVWHVVEPKLVRDWCEAMGLPSLTEGGWATCSVVTQADAKRLAAHKRLVEQKRQENK